MFQLDQEAFNAKIEEKLTSILIDFEVENAWYHAALKSLDFASPLTLGITPEKMQKLEDRVTSRERLSYYEFAIFNNLMQTVLKRDMEPMLRGLPENYYDVQKLAQRYAGLWNVKGKAIHNDVMTEMMKSKMPPGVSQMIPVAEA